MRIGNSPGLLGVSVGRLAAALNGRRIGAGWMGHCPAHDDRRPSLSILGADNGTVLVRCHAGCDQSRVIAALRARGLWLGRRDEYRYPGDQPPRRDRARQQESETITRTALALDIWAAGKPARCTPVETYLRSRGLFLPLPKTLRFHPGLKHPSGGVWPAMLALVTRGFDDTPLAIHRTFLARDGAGKAPVDQSKMMLGPCRGGAVRLAALGDALMVGEGIETCLAALQETQRPAWAALSTSGLRALDLPADISDVIVLADGDEAGEAAAYDAALRWKHERRHARIARPPRGLDFNDFLLLCRAARVAEGRCD